MALACVLGAVAALVVSRDGVGITVDSAEYLAVAESVSEGDGLTMPYLSYDEPYPVGPVEIEPTVPLTAFPPGYPITLGVAATALSVSARSAARALNVLLYAATLGAAAHLVLRSTRRASRSLVAVALLAMSHVVLTYGMAWSETLFLFLVMAGLLATDRYVATRSPPWLFALGAATLIAPLTRFAGVFLGLAASVALWAVHRLGYGDERPGVSLKVVPIPIGLGVLGAAGWFVGNRLASGAASEKSLSWHPPRAGDLRDLLVTAGTWIGLDTWPTSALRSLGTVVALALLTAVLAALVRAHRTRAQGRRWTPAATAAVGAASYAAVLAGSKTVVDANINFDTRHLLTLYALLAIAVTSAVPPRRVRASLLALLVPCLGLIILDSARLLRDFPGSETSGYTAVRWQTSSLLGAVKDLPQGAVIVTNAPDAVQLQARRPTLFIPLSSDIYSIGPNVHYESQLQALRAATSERPAYLAFFDRPTRGGRRRLAEAAIAALSAAPLEDFDDGTLYCVGCSSRRG